MFGYSRVLPFGPSCTFLLGLFIAGRLLVSYLPCDSWGPSGYLCSAPYLTLPLGSSHTSVAKAAIPEGARLSNRIDFLHFREERFTVDERGYRNGPLVKVDKPQGILFGSSFSLGLALSDEETFSAQLNQQLGPVIYNAAGTFNRGLSADHFANVAHASGMDHGWIVIEILNRSSFYYSQSPARSRSSEFMERLLPGASQPMASVTSAIRRIGYPYAVTRSATLINMRLHDGNILPNPFHDRYTEEQLVTGQKVLMSRNDTRFAQRPSDANLTASALLRLNNELERRGYHLAVILLPNGYSVYYPLLRNHTGPDLSEPYLREIRERLAAEHVAVLNLLPVLRSAAAAELSNGRMIFYPDDAHWNPLGCSIAAHAAAPWLQSLFRGGAVSEK